MDSSALDIAIKTLEKDISGLESSIDGLEKWLWISSAAVAIGVILEIVFLIHEYLENRASWRRGILVPPSRPSFRLLSFEIASVVLVVAGIVGELWVGVVSANRNTDLRSKNNRFVGLVREKAGNAQITAGDANKAAGAAKERAGKLELDAATLRKQNLELERALSPRVLSVKAQQDLTTLLKPFAPIAASLQYPQGDEEARRLASQLILPLSLAWRTERAVPAVNVSDVTSTFGILIGFNMFGLSKTDADRLQGAADMLAKRLNNDGIRTITNPIMNPDLRYNRSGLLVVGIGLKPNPIEDKRFMEILEREPEPFRSAQIKKWFPEKKR